MIAAALMAGAVFGVTKLMQSQPPFDRLIVEIVAGAVIYIVVLVAIDRETLRLLGEFGLHFRRLSAPARQRQPAE
jgi:hypothetical protein